VRSFIAIELPENIKERWQNSLNVLSEHFPEINWVKRDNLHITLKFMGWVEENMLMNMAKDIRENINGLDSFAINLKGSGFFPDNKNPEVIWVGTEENKGGLLELFNKIETCSEKHGIKNEKHGFHAHVTIGRMSNRKKHKRGDLDNLITLLSNHEENLAGTFSVAFLSIMQSVLTPKGPAYKRLEKINLN
jgi:RNA 2',3'-cyclic 3'-phosphodiesterase